MTNDAVLSNLNVTTNFGSIDNAFLVDVDIITNLHLDVLELLLDHHVAWSNNTFFADYCENANFYLCKIPS